MTADLQSEFYQILPHHTGFYRCAVYLNGLYLDDESDVPYPTEHMQEPAEPVNFTNCMERVPIFLKRSTLVTLDLSRDRTEIKCLKLKTMPMPVLLLPHGTISEIQRVGVFRSRVDLHSRNVWKEQLSCKKHENCEPSVLEKLMDEAKGTLKYLKDPDAHLDTFSSINR